ncbi:MAG: hypothetical protein HN576_16680 [Bacteriovoracaceae bacterium]|jgi:hypothetical protein|nr:hypothetical protein [Bacteriovoracaceae bacterium]
MKYLISQQKLFTHCAYLTAIFSVISCGLINDQQMSEKLYGMNSLQSVCKIDTEKFKQITKEDISPQIDCLENNLNKFAKFVRRKDQKLIEREELKKFMDKFMEMDIKLTDSLLYIVFQINSLVLKDNPNTIKVTNIRSFITLIRLFNREGIVLKSVMEDIKRDGYLNHRESFVKLMNKQSLLIKEIVNNRENNSCKIKILDFLKKIKTSLKLPKKTLNLKLVDSLLFIKKLFIGGKSQVLTSVDMDILIERLPQLVKVIFDAINVTPAYFKADHEYYRFQIENLTELESVILKLNLNENLIAHKQLMKLMEQLVPKYNWKYMSRSLLIAKKDFIKDQSTNYNFGNFRAFLNIYRQSLEIRFFNSLSFELLKDKLASPFPIQTLLFPQHEAYKILTKEKNKELWREFKHIVLNYRVFTSPELLNTYSYNFRRTPTGINLMAIERWFSKKIYKIYAVDKSRDGEKSLSKDQARSFVYNYEELLAEFGILNNGAERLIRELIMGSDLFQEASNGDNRVQIDELAQVVPMVISSNKFGIEIYEKMNRYCDPMEVKEGFDMNCYRENFFPILFYDLNFNTYFPNSFNYFKQTNHETIIQLLIDSEGQAKIDQSPHAPMTKTDMKRMMANVSNSEALFLKYDIDRNGYFDKVELDNLYNLFEHILTGISKLKPGSKLLRSLFSYIISKKKLPSKLALIKFHLLGRKKNIKATRANIAAILGMIGRRMNQEP